MNWLVGEYGDTLRVEMPFGLAGGEIVLKVRTPSEQSWRSWDVDVIEDEALEHVLQEGDLTRVGIYRGVVEVLADGRLRKAIFSFSVGGLTGSEIEGATA